MLQSSLEGRMRRLGIAGIVATALALGATVSPVGPSFWSNPLVAPLHAQTDPPPDGRGRDCVEFGLFIPTFPIIINTDSIFPDEGWVWIEPQGRRLRSVAGVVVGTDVARNDTPANHESHDLDAAILVDTGYEGLVSPANRVSEDSTLEPDPSHPRPPDLIGMEWETGIRPSEKRGDGANPIFPKWAWPSVGDRLWAEGHWVYDCGHPSDVKGTELFRSEIHPARAVAAMRDQAATLPGTGTTPVAVTATDLYIHGNGGFITSQLTCGMGIILDPFGLPEGCHTVLTPINDTDFEFDVCLPPRPNHPFARLTTRVEDGPGNTVPDSIARPEISNLLPASDDCQRGDRFDDGAMVHVKIPLNGKPVEPAAVYARRIVSGWVFPPAEVLKRLSVTLNQMDLHDDTDEIPLDQGELTFFWMGVDRAPNEWIRLADHTEGMNNYDDSPGAGNGEKNFTNAGFEFYVRTGQPFTVSAHGYDQDCFDDYFGFHFLTPLMYVGCWTVDLDEFGNNDAMRKLPIEADLTDDAGQRGLREDAIFRADENYGIGPQDLHAWRIVSTPVANGQFRRVLGSEYELELTVAEIPAIDEDRADLQVTKRCEPSGEVFLANVPFTCTITVTNLGPGLPRSVHLQDVLTGQVPASAISVTSATIAFPAPYAGTAVQCPTTASNAFSCDLGTVPVGGTATIVATIVTTEPGALENRAVVSTLSTDSDSANNEAKASIDVFRPILLDIAPGRLPNSINLGKSGVVSVAVLTTPEFDARTVQGSGLCFGSASSPSSRDCTEAHSTSHTSDVDRDRDIDLLLHFEALQTGIRLSDTKACLIGRGSDGIGVYGCDSVRPVMGT